MKLMVLQAEAICPAPLDLAITAVVRLRVRGWRVSVFHSVGLCWCSNGLRDFLHSGGDIAQTTRALWVTDFAGAGSSFQFCGDSLRYRAAPGRKDFFPDHRFREAETVA